jgi:hypothetical protein
MYWLHSIVKRFENKKSLQRGWAPLEALYTLQPTLKASDKSSRKEFIGPLRFFPPFA